MDTKLSPTSRRTRTRIIDAVVDSVAAHGISGTTLATVAKRAGVSQGVLVFHFKTKEGLLAETLRRLSDEYRAAWEPALAEDDPLDRVLGLVAADFSPAVCTRKKLALWFAFWGEAGARPIFSAICEAAEDTRYRAMVAACEALAARHGTPGPALLADAIDATTDGLWLQMHIYGKRLGRTGARDVALGHLRLLLPGLADRI
ncbi:TetR/AcrR family transcriptional regulator [Albidovulum sp.]|jgi:AcrR family transcriptional regulator|uniref:TetR/AcrR family transcriptional regulator n=1 Tax=Albidovulum sp. TaxID=1872424 RepID=UPI00306BD9AF